MTPAANLERYKNHRFPPEIISHAVWLYHRFPLRYRDVEEMLLERGLIERIPRIPLDIRFQARRP